MHLSVDLAPCSFTRFIFNTHAPHCISGFHSSSTPDFSCNIQNSRTWNSKLSNILVLVEARTGFEVFRREAAPISVAHVRQKTQRSDAQICTDMRPEKPSPPAPLEPAPDPAPPPGVLHLSSSPIEWSVLVAALTRHQMGQSVTHCGAGPQTKSKETTAPATTTEQLRNALLRLGRR